MGRYDYDDYYGYKPYVPVAQRRAQAEREVAKRLKKGQEVSPIRIEGRTIASTFWGKAWCTNLESYSDFANRLPRGRTYVRNGSVVHLKIDKGRIEALVSGSDLYEIQIDIAPLSKDDWRVLKQQSAGKIGTIVELLQGKLSKAVMELVTGREHGLFPKPKEIKMRCSCPDSARLCKHLAAVLYGVGSRLDSSPELLFVLRGVDHLELIEQAIPTGPIKGTSNAPTIATDDLGAIFDIEIGDTPVAAADTKIDEKGSAEKAPKAIPNVKKASAAAKKASAAPTKAKAVPKKASTTAKRSSVAPKKATAAATRATVAPKKATAAATRATAAPKKTPATVKTSSTAKKTSAMSVPKAKKQ